MSETKYEAAQQRWTGAIGEFQRRANVAWCVAGLAVVYSLGAEWRHEMLLSRAKVAGAEPKVIEQRCDGTLGEARLIPASEYGMADGLVYRRLEDVVRCMRGLEGDAAKVHACWLEIQPMFRGAAAKRYEADSASLLGKPDEFRRRVENDRIEVKHDRAMRHRAAGGGYGISWQETGKRNGRPVDETWSGVFTVELVSVEDGGMAITDYRWEQAQ